MRSASSSTGTERRFESGSSGAGGCHSGDAYLKQRGPGSHADGPPSLLDETEDVESKWQERVSGGRHPDRAADPFGQVNAQLLRRDETAADIEGWVTTRRSAAALTEPVRATAAKVASCRWGAEFERSDDRALSGLHS